MIAHNPCYTTMLKPNELAQHPALKPEECTRCQQTYFVKADKLRGLLPEILTNLLTERKRVKGLMKAIKAQGKHNTMQYSR